MKKALLVLSFFIYSTIGAQNIVFDWAKSMGSSGTDHSKGTSIVVDTAGNVYSTGYFYGITDFDPGVGVFNLGGGSSGENFFISKLDANGDFVWARAMEGVAGGSAYGNSIALDGLGNVYTTGYFYGTIDFDPGALDFSINASSANVCDVFISKLDASGNFVWAKAFGMGNISGTCSRGNSIAIDTSGNVYTAGDFNGTVDFDPGSGTFNLSTSSVSDNDVFISKLDASGNFVWARAMGGSNVDIARSIVLDPAGNVFTTGDFRATADFDPNSGIFNLSPGGQDIFVSKLDSSGNFIWAKAFGGGVSSNNQGNSIALDTSENVYITGNFYGIVDFDPNASVFNVSSVGGQNVFISKLDSYGNFLWAKGMGGSPYNDGRGNSIAVDPYQNVYTTGSFHDTVDFDPNAGVFNLISSASSNVFISKLDASGNFVCAKKMEGTSFSAEGNSIVLDISGNAYTTGFFQGTVDFDSGAGMFNLTSVGWGYNSFVHKMNPCTNTSSSITQNACFNYVLNGQTYNTSGTYTQVFVNSAGCDSILTLYLTVINNTQPICLVTVDSASNHNIIVWEKQSTTQIDSFRIYREVSSNVYSQIASVAYDSLSEYHDYAANPNVTSYKYKIEILSSCGTLSDMGDFHNTIHLQNFGGNLQWTLYNIENTGNPVTYYRIFRDDNGTGNFLPISSNVPGGNSTYTDINFSSFPAASYLVDVTWSKICTPTRSMGTTRSNILRSSIAGVSTTKEENKPVLIYPNPTRGIVTIELSELIGNSILKIIDVLGVVKYNESLSSKVKTINVEDYSKGIYTLIIENNGNKAYKKLVVN